MMQRVGRINRVDTQFDTIYTFNFFPTQQANDEIKLKEAAEAKINAFLTLLGGDAALLTEGEPVGSHELFNRLTSVKTVTGEDEAETSDLEYLTLIKDIRDNDPDLFEKVKRLPRKSRSSKISPVYPYSLVTYFRKGKVQKFFLSGPDIETVELDFLTAADTLESQQNEIKQKLPETYFELLDRNKAAFIEATTAELIEIQPRRGRDNTTKILRILKAVFKNTQQLTDDQEEYAKAVVARLEAGGIPKQTAKTTLKALNDLGNQLVNPLKVLAVLQTIIPERLLRGHYAEVNPRGSGKREVILSLYLAEKEIIV